MNLVERTTGRGGLPLLKIQTPWSTAEIHLLGAQVTHFQKHGEAPLLFLSEKSRFAVGKAIRGGVPICYPWFGARAGDSAHGFVRTVLWEWTAKRMWPIAARSDCACAYLICRNGPPGKACAPNSSSPLLIR